MAPRLIIAESPHWPEAAESKNKDERAFPTPGEGIRLINGFSDLTDSAAPVEIDGVSKPQA
jgi:hypothetical protein